MPLLGARGRTRRAAGDRLIDARGPDGPSPRGQLGCGRTLGIMDLPDRLVDLLQAPSLCFITTLMPNGSPHITQTWVDTDGKNIIINTVQGSRRYATSSVTRASRWPSPTRRTRAAIWRSAAASST
jgi:hypothetical protein